MTEIRAFPGMTRDQLRAAEKASGRGSTPDAPLIVRFEPGVYDMRVQSFSLQADYRVILAHGARFEGPTSGSRQGVQKFEAPCNAIDATMEGGELVGTDVGGLAARRTACRQLFRGVSFRDVSASQDGLGCNNWEGSTLKASSRAWVPTRDEPWVTEIEGCEFIDYAGHTITHPIYLHGRYGELHVRDSIFAGGHGSSAVKSTRNVNTVRRCKFYSESRMLRGEAPIGERSFGKFIDVPAAGEVVVSDCEFYGAFQGSGSAGAVGGTTHMVAIRNRRDFWGDDAIPAADISYQRSLEGAFNAFRLRYRDCGLHYTAGSAVVDLDGRQLRTLAVPSYPNYSDSINDVDSWEVTVYPDELPVSGSWRMGIEPVTGRSKRANARLKFTVYRDAQHLLVSSMVTASPETLGAWAKPEFWSPFGDLRDPSNPNTYKAWLSGNRFVRVQNPANRLRGTLLAIWTEGLYPAEATRQFAVTNRLHPVPSTWVDRSTVFECENTFEGWAPDETTTRVDTLGDFRDWGDERWGDGGEFLENPPMPTLVTVEPEVVLSTRKPEWFKR